MNLRITLYVLCIGSIIFLSCSNETNHNIPELSGTWQANWHLSDGDLNTIFTSDQMKMQGEITFNEGRLVNIKAYGFQGCVFTSDTTENQLFYSINDSIFNLKNSSDEVIFSYVILEKQQDYIRMVLMDDLHLTLKR